MIVVPCMSFVLGSVVVEPLSDCDQHIAHTC